MKYSFGIQLNIFITFIHTYISFGNNLNEIPNSCKGESAVFL